MIKRKSLDRWTVQESAELYGIREWGAGYFDIAKSGEVIVRPRGAGSRVSVSLLDLVAGIRDRGMGMPVLLRFSDILDSRVAAINEQFAEAIAEAGYQGRYQGVYPIKVNQQQQVIEEIATFGRRYHHGLEAGSKAELIAALAYMNDPEALIICNGYKDAEFLDLALSGLKMGIQTMIVLEMPGELELLLERAAAMNVRPRIGIRVKLSSKAGGHWTESGGDRSVFGLNTAQIIEVVDTLRQHGMLDCLQLVHYHLGSQIPNIRSIRTAVAEACRYYVSLVKEGARMGYLDIGGGLAVDYDGSHTNFESSSNYALREYCSDVIEVVMDTLGGSGIPHPVLVSESGRATVAYYSVLLFNILDVGRFGTHGAPDKPGENLPELVRSLIEVHQSFSSKNFQECFHDAVYYRDEVRTGFMRGEITLRERALAEQIFWQILSRMARESKGRKYVPDELQGLEASLCDIYYGNFSVFQSLPDAWAIDQLFPIMPIHRLNEMPTRKAILSDITCDCDGKIDKFIDLHDVRNSLDLHELREDEDYFLGVFLVGAYQETLGDLHNLLGDTNVVTVQINDEGAIEFRRELDGDSVSDVLSYVEYDVKDLVERYRRTAELAVQARRITAQERRRIVEAYEAGLRGYTYFERE
ncbi:MAG: Biosynthetic arginine decarboxylase [Lentisphaerae bacterium ADurb.BinA184]|nr:MAG: Biosynthetic arginine decarboxylase [Lentisphaerae bacterium ADurb.BinA184]